MTNPVSDPLFRQFFDRSADPMWVFDNESLRFLDVNASACKRYGYSRDEFLSMTLFDIRPEEDMFLLRVHRIQSNCEGCPNNEQVWRHRTKSGQVIFSKVSVVPIEVDGVSAKVVTVHEPSEEEARTAEKIAFFRLSQDLMMIRNLSGKLIWINEAVERLLGWTISEAMQMDFASVLHPDDLACRNRTFTQLIENGGSAVWETRARRRDGVYIWLQCSCTADLPSDRLYLVCRDITEPKELSERLLNDEMLLSKSQALAKMGSWSYDFGTNALALSDECYRLLGLEPACFPQDWESCLKYIHPDDVAAVSTPESLISSDDSPYEHVIRALLPSGEIAYLRCRTYATRNEAGEVVRLDGIVKDITSSQTAQEELTQVLSTAHCVLWQAQVLEQNDELEWNLKVKDSEFARALFAPEILASHTLSDAKFAEELPTQNANSAYAIRNGLPGYQQEFRIRDVNGNVRWLYEVVSINKRSDGLWRLTGVCTDVTQRKLAEEQILRSQRRYQRIADNVPGVVFQYVFLKSGGFECPFVNGASRNLLELEPEQVMANPSILIDSVHPKDRPSLDAAIAEAAQTMSPVLWNGRMVTATGEVKWIHGTARPEALPNGDLLWDGLLLDVTEHRRMQDELLRYQADLEERVAQRTAALEAEIVERREAEEKLRESERRYRAVVEDQTELIARHDENGVFTFVNEAHCRHFGAPAEALLGRSFFQFLDPDALSFVKGYLASLGPDYPVASHEASHATPEGRTIWTHWTTRYIMDERGDFEEFQAVGRDITEQKEAEIALKAAKEEAERANVAKSEFLSRMSHELRTPLNAILGFGQVLDRQKLDPLAKESVQYILTAGQHLLSLINEVLDISRVEAGKTDLSIEPVCVSEVVFEAADMVRSLAADRSIAVRIDQESLSGYVSADKQRLKQILINFLSNAVKYNLPEGNIDVFACHPHPSIVRINVRDTGPGIKAEDMDKLFKPFERLSAHTSEVEGTGLGLALSQRLAGLMHGAVAAESTVGQGSTFYVDLPACDAPYSKQVSDVVRPDDSAPHGQHGAYSVLCIEDNLSNLRLLEVVLANRPEIVLSSAMQGSVGLDLAHHLRPNLILLDLNLPDMSGAKVLERLRGSAATKHIPVFIVSADATEGQINRLLAAGADGYLTKPLDISEFLAKLDAVLVAESAAA